MAVVHPEGEQEDVDNHGPAICPSKNLAGVAGGVLVRLFHPVMRSLYRETGRPPLPGLSRASFILPDLTDTVAAYGVDQLLEPGVVSPEDARKLRHDEWRPKGYHFFYPLRSTFPL
jgi:hypothetical protein